MNSGPESRDEMQNVICSLQLQTVWALIRPYKMLSACADPESLVRVGPTLSMLFVFPFFDGEIILIPLKAGQYRLGRETLFKCRFDCGPMVAQHNTLHARLKDLLFFLGSGPVLLRKPYIFVIFQRGQDPLSPSGSAHGLLITFANSLDPDQA